MYQPKDRTGHAAWLAALALLACGARAADPALVEAARAGDARALGAAIAESTDIDARAADGATALHHAAALDRVDLAAALLAAGANPDAANRYRVTPLSLAADNGSAMMIEQLLAAGAGVDVAAGEGQTPLMLAAANGRTDAVELLLRHGADVNAREAFRGQTALMWAAGNGNAAAVDLLIDHGAEIDARSKQGFTALLFAVRNAELAALRSLIGQGADVNAIGPDGTSALNLAVVNAYYEIAAELLNGGADPNLKDPRGSPLHTLAWLRRPGATGTAAVGGEAEAPPTPVGNVTSLELARLLLQAGADPNVRIDWSERRFSVGGGTARNPPNIELGRHLLSYAGATPFYIAAKNGDPALMRVLVEGGADPTITTRYGITPLMVAAGMDYWEGETPGPHTGTPEAERLEAVELAIELGNDVNARADFGDFEMLGDAAYTLLYYPHNIAELLDLGVGDPRWSGSTALHGSIISNQPSIVQLLIDRGADVDAENALGWTPLMMSRGVFLANAEREFPAAEAILLEALAKQGVSARP